VVVALEAASVGDLAGFLAAIFMRGVPVIQVPTTLLAQVDAPSRQDRRESGLRQELIGSFHQPLAVLIDPDVLRTLPDREYRAGLYEILKCASSATRRCSKFWTGMPPRFSRSTRPRWSRSSPSGPNQGRSGHGRRARGTCAGFSTSATPSGTPWRPKPAMTPAPRRGRGLGMHAATILAERTGRLSAAAAGAIHRAIARYGPIPSSTTLTRKGSPTLEKR